MTLKNKLDERTEFTREWLDANLVFKYSCSDITDRILVYGIEEYEKTRTNKETGEEEPEHNRFIMERQPNQKYKVANSYFMPSEQQREQAFIKAMNEYKKNEYRG